MPKHTPSERRKNAANRARTATKKKASKSKSKRK